MIAAGTPADELVVGPLHAASNSRTGCAVLADRPYTQAALVNAFTSARLGSAVTTLQQHTGMIFVSAGPGGSAAALAEAGLDRTASGHRRRQLKHPPGPVDGRAECDDRPVGVVVRRYFTSPRCDDEIRASWTSALWGGSPLDLVVPSTPRSPQLTSSPEQAPSG